MTLEFDNIATIESRLKALELEKTELLQKLRALQATNTPLIVTKQSEMIGKPTRAEKPVSPEEKISLFLELFCARESVFPRLWENSVKQSKGYAPACANEWKAGICGKPRVKCSECENRAFLALDETAARNHLLGVHSIGTYAIREDDTCIFLAADFDGDGWKGDLSTYRLAGKELGVDVKMERSRSGNGGHAWIFFSEPVPARMARLLGTQILSRAMSARHTMNLGTYDRFFPNQDSLPKGGFGNLIALPLQKKPRDQGNSVFLDDDFTPASDQWALLAGIRRLSCQDLQNVLELHSTQDTLNLGITENDALSENERALDAGLSKITRGIYDGKVTIELRSQLSVEIASLPSMLIAALKRTATFANPKYFEMQRLRFSTWKTPRFIYCGEVFPDKLFLPRGTLEACRQMISDAGAQAEVVDHRVRRAGIRLSFKGTLSKIQKECVRSILKEEIGVLVAPPGSGKTVMACAIIGKRKVTTLILVHRMPLLEQWRSRVTTFLNLPAEQVGSIAGSLKRRTGIVDIAMLQSLSRMDDISEILTEYEQLIIDECHHIPAVSFESVLKHSPARFVLGLTATPYRKDGHQAIIHMQCGPVRHEIEDLKETGMEKRVIVRETSFVMPQEAGPQPPIHQIWESLVGDMSRTAVVARDVCDALANGRFPLVISERRLHLDLLEEEIRREETAASTRSFFLVGGMGKKERKRILDEISEAITSGVRPCLLATGSYIGEGFDLPALDTLILAMPISFRGKIVQYTGRLLRSYPGKTGIVIHDYMDSCCALTLSMFKKRMSTYKRLGFFIDGPI